MLARPSWQQRQRLFEAQSEESAPPAAAPIEREDRALHDSPVLTQTDARVAQAHPADTVRIAGGVQLRQEAAPRVSEEPHVCDTARLSNGLHILDMLLEAISLVVTRRGARAPLVKPNDAVFVGEQVCDRLQVVGYTRPTVQQENRTVGHAAVVYSQTGTRHVHETSIERRHGTLQCSVLYLCAGSRQ